MLCSGLSGPPGGPPNPPLDASLATLSDGGCLEVNSESQPGALISEGARGLWPHSDR